MEEINKWLIGKKLGFRIINDKLDWKKFDPTLFIR